MEGPFPSDTLLRQYELALPADKVSVGLARSQPGKGLSPCLPNKTVIGNFARKGSESSLAGTDGGFSLASCHANLFGQIPKKVSIFNQP